MEARTMVLGFPVGVVVVLIAVTITAVTDIWKYKVYNALTIPLLISGMVYHAYTGGANGLAISILGAAFGFGSLLAFYLLGGMGAGDVKLLAAVGAWLGLQQTYYVFLATCLVTGGYSLFLILSNGRLAETWLNLQILWHRINAFGRYMGAEERVEAVVNDADRASRLIPFGAMVAIGVIVSLAWGALKVQP
jgi:prepilin peptidase CpaA